MHMRVPRTLARLATAHHQAARMNELARVVRAELTDNGHGFSHRDTESHLERAWQNPRDELHIGFRAQ